MADLSSLSDADLLALQRGDLSAVSTAGLEALSGSSAPAKSPRDQWQEELRKAPAESADPGMRGGRLDALLTGIRAPVDELAVLVPKALASATSIGGRFENPVSRALAAGAQEAQDVNMANEQAYQAARQQQGREGFDAARLAGNIVSPANLIPATRASGLLSRGAQAVGAGKRVAQAVGATGAGATYGLLSPSEDQSLGEKASQVAIGAALGPVADVAAQGVGALLRPSAREAQKTLIREGVTLTPGQYIGGVANVAEQKMMSVPFIGDAIAGARKKGEVELNRAVANRALKPIGQSLPKDVKPGYEATQHVRKTLQSEYDALLPNLTFAPDQQLIGDLQNITQMVKLMPPQQAQQFERIFKDRVLNRMTQQGRMNGGSFKKIEADLRTQAQKFMRDPDTNNRDMGAALGELLASFRRGLIRNNPDQAPRLQAINEGWANYARLRRAAGMQATDEGLFTPGQLTSAVRAEDATKGKRAFSEGEALMQDLAGAARGVMQTKYPDSGTAGRALLGGGLLAGVAVEPTTAAIMAASSAPYLLRRPTQSLLQGTEALARPTAEFLSDYGQYGALPFLLPLTQ